jgi:lisH domain-containing protein FOPNL
VTFKGVDINTYIFSIKKVLNEALENKGVINELKSKLRAEVFTILEDNSYEKPKVSQENLLINEMIREYMEFNHYKYSKSVFVKGIFPSKSDLIV